MMKLRSLLLFLPLLLGSSLVVMAIDPIEAFTESGRMDGKQNTFDMAMKDAGTPEATCFVNLDQCQLTNLPQA